MKNYKKALSVIASVAIAGAAIALLTKTEKGKQLLTDMKKKKHCNGQGAIESI